jgi:hypothetical protein
MVKDQKLCVHCQDRVADTKDHWLPKKWWPAGVLPNIERWTFPSCRECNGKLGEVENRLRTRLALALDPEAPSAQGIVPALHRSIDPDHGHDKRDSAARRTRRDELFQELFPGDSVPPNSILPSLGEPLDSSLSGRLATAVSAEDLDIFVAKLVRGLTYIQLRDHLKPRYSIQSFFMRPCDAMIFTEHLDRHRELIDFTPALRARVTRAADDRFAAICEFVIWESLPIYALVLPEP